MTDKPAAIRATFCDFRLIKSRKQAQLVLEVPIEEADAALAALGGIPQPHSEKWVGVALMKWRKLNGGVEHEPEPESKEKRRWEDLKLSMQASIRCGEPAFWKFLREGIVNEYFEVKGGDDAANAVRAICDVSSRSGLNANPAAAARWKSLDRQYQAWLKAVE